MPQYTRSREASLFVVEGVYLFHSPDTGALHTHHIPVSESRSATKPANNTCNRCSATASSSPSHSFYTRIILSRSTTPEVANCYSVYAFEQPSREALHCKLQNLRGANSSASSLNASRDLHGRVKSRYGQVIAVGSAHHNVGYAPRLRNCLNE